MSTFIIGDIYGELEQLKTEMYRDIGNGIKEFGEEGLISVWERNEMYRDIGIEISEFGEEEVLSQSQIDSIFEGHDMVSDGTSKIVLVIDDAPFMRVMLKDILTKSGHTVLLAEGGKMALRMLEEEKVDLCILDILMPDMNGMDVLKHICANMPEMKVIMLSAMAYRNTVEEALRIGAGAFVVKPFLVDNIIKRV